MMKNTRTLRTAAVLLAGALLAGCHKPGADADKGGKGKDQGPQAVPVQTIAVHRGTIESAVPVTGNIQALQDVQIAARVTARVASVAVREGDFVRAGQVIVRQDTTDLQANVRQAQANVANAQSQVAQAVTNYQIQVAQAKQNVLNARAALAAAQQNYLKVLRGSRPQQVLQAQAQVDQAKANLDNAKTTLTRNQTLFQQGAIAKADLDTAQTTYNVNLEQYKNQLANLSLVKAGAQQEDIASALEQVREQKANLANQVANQQQVALRRQQIQAAQASVRQAQATLAYNQEQVSYTAIRSPINGIVAARETEPGQIASPTSSVMRIVNVKTTYFLPTVSEQDFSKIGTGNPVSIQFDALSGRTYDGKVAAIYPAASTTNRTFSLRVNIPNPRGEIRPGMFARGQIVTDVHRNVVVVPVSALLSAQQNGLAANTSSQGQATGGTSLPNQQVMVVGPNQKAVAKSVTVGAVSGAQAQITRGLQPGEQLIVVGQGLVQPGQKVQVADKTASSGAPGGA